MKKNPSASKPTIPTPAHPHHRREPLPWCQPKPSEEDRDAPKRIKAIMESPSYRQADQDIEYLNQDETRGVRLQIDYQKPEFLLQQHGIEHTIVVFGSTRIHEPATAQTIVEGLSAQLATDPDNAALQRRLRVAERLLEKSHYYEVAREFGQLVCEAGKTVDDGQ